MAPIVPQVAPSFAREEVATGQRRARLEDVAAALHQLERESATALNSFEQAGGRQAVQSFLRLSAQLQGNIISREDIDALLKQLPTVCRLLEVEQLLVDLLSTRASDAPR